MILHLLTSFLLLVGASLPALAATYYMSDNIQGNGFYSAFEWQAISDPTHGRVRYVDQGTSRSQNLTSVNGNRFIMRADYWTTLNPSGPGRNSVRIRSWKTYSRHVAVFDLYHMPEGCGTWPAIWEVAESGWPYGGEVDIMEGVNNQSPNAATLHTSAGCVMPSSGRSMTGTATQRECDVNVNSNSGCGVKFNDWQSFGPSFNSNGGGWFAMERANNYIKVWFWPRNSGSVPSDVRNGNSQVNPDSWGTAAAHFPNTQCDFGQYFWAHNIVINLTLCGDWAGSVYGNSGCPSTCVDYVNYNPWAFQNAYFDFGAIRVYT
ncbi:endo-beta-glucanase [Coprinopsis sp. MPI-PUGE-AT-0042]|nr:endo-beta-glucanase [Coprinopsis sp. MPI-PUGE-AT-0042]